MTSNVFKKGNDEPFHHLRCRKALPDVIVDLLQSLGDGTQRVGVTLIEGGEDAVLVGEEVIERANGGARLLGETMHRQARFAIALQHLRAGIQNGGDTLVSTVLLWLDTGDWLAGWWDADIGDWRDCTSGGLTGLVM